jgi:hypothetical protein
MAAGKQLSDNNGSGTALGQSATDTISFYGATPVAQRASIAGNASTLISVSSNATIASNLGAWMAEVNATLQALGIWAAH